MVDLMRGTLAVCVAALLVAACGDDVGASGAGSGGAGGSSSDGGSSGHGRSSGDGGSDGDGAGSGDGGSSGANNPASSGSGTSQAGPSTGVGSSGVTTVAAVTSTAAGGDDEYAAQRQICVDKINALRATEGLPGYGRWGDAEECTDGEATSDEQSDTPHGAFGTCGEHGQDECLGHGPDGISECLDQMWAEKDQPECGGCSLCHDTQGDCANCVFQSCGHYVNMSALYFTEVACGFSDLGGWDTQNFR